MISLERIRTYVEGTKLSFPNDPALAPIRLAHQYLADCADAFDEQGYNVSFVLQQPRLSFYLVAPEIFSTPPQLTLHLPVRLAGEKAMVNAFIPVAPSELRLASVIRARTKHNVETTEQFLREAVFDEKGELRDPTAKTRFHILSRNGTRAFLRTQCAASDWIPPRRILDVNFLQVEPVRKEQDDAILVRLAHHDFPDDDKRPYPLSVEQLIRSHTIHRIL